MGGDAEQAALSRGGDFHGGDGGGLERAVAQQADAAGALGDEGLTPREPRDAPRGVEPLGDDVDGDGHGAVGAEVVRDEGAVGGCLRLALAAAGAGGEEGEGRQQEDAGAHVASMTGEWLPRHRRVRGRPEVDATGGMYLPVTVEASTLRVAFSFYREV